MHDAAKFLSEPLTVVALCAIGGGIMLMVIAWAFTGEYERGGRDPVHRRPPAREVKPWMLDSSGKLILPPAARHRQEDTEGHTRNLAAYVPLVTGRARVVTIGPDGEEHSHGDHEGPGARVRIDAGEGHEQEEGREDSERGEDEDGAVPDGEEGRSYPESPSQVTAWRYIPSVDRYVYIADNGEILQTIDAASWEDDRGRVAYHLFKQGYEMIPEFVPYYVVEKKNLKGLY